MLEFQPNKIFTWRQCNISCLLLKYINDLVNAQGYRPKPPRFPSRMPGAVIGAHSACAEHGLTLEELDAAIADGSKPIVRRDGIVLAQRTRELPKRPFVGPRLPRPTSPVRVHLRGPLAGLYHAHGPEEFHSLLRNPGRFLLAA